jgi:hypothetical protein
MSLLDNLRAQAPALRNVDDETLKQTLRVQPEFRAYSDEQFEALVTGAPSADTSGRNSETIAGFVGDLVDAGQMGAYNVAQGLGDFSYEYTGVGRGLGNFGREGAASQLEQMSPRAADAIQQQIFESTGSGLWDFKLGEGANPLTIALQTASLAGEAVASGGLAGGGSRVGLSLTGKVIGRTARRNAARQGLDEAGQQAAAVQAMRDFASSRTADGVKLGTYGAVETAVNTGQIADGAYQEILAMPDEELDQSQAFAETYWQLADENPNASVDELRQQAREQLGQGAKSLVMRDPALLLTTGVLGGYGGKVLDDLVTKGTRAGGGRLGAAVRQAAVQGTAETGQGGMGQYSINSAVAEIGADPNRNPMEGVAAAGLSEGFIGGVMGGGTGALAGRPRTQESITQAREQAAAQGGDALDQATAGLGAEQQAQGEQQAAERSPEAQAQRQQQASETGLRIQRGMADADDLQALARGSSFEGGTRLRNMRMITERAEAALEAGNVEQASRLMERAENIANNLRSALRTTGTRERPMEGELADPEQPQPVAGLLGGGMGRLPPGTGDSIRGESPQQFEARQRTQQEQADTLNRRSLGRDNVIYGEGPIAGNANNGLDQSFERARFTDTGARNAVEGQRPRQQESAERVAQLARTRGRGQTTYLPDNTPIRTRFRVVEASELTASNSPDGRVNQRYPQELQPRDRTNANSQVQVRNIAARLNPERLGSSNDAGTGAPIIGSDGVVESGNGRTMAITTAYGQNSPQAQRYREFVRAEAQRQGIDPSAVDEMQQPVLVRERITNVDRADFARRANESQVAGMTAYEQAQSDADSLTADDLQAWQPDESGDPLAATNRGFQRGFVQRLGNNEASRYTTRDGQATPELGQRMQRAVFAAAYQDPDMVEMVTEQAENMRNLAAGLQAAAADLAVARETGSRDALDAIGTINDAVRLVRRSRQDGISVRELTRQTDAFSDPVPETTALLAIAINNNMRSRQAMTAAFGYIGRAVRSRAEGEANGALFADDTTNQDIFDAGFQGQNQNQRTQQRPPERDVQPGTQRREQGAERQGQAEPAQRPPAEQQAQEVDDEPLLSTYTEQELAEREQAQQQAEEAEASQQREQAQRAQADREAVDFNLTGSNRTADVAAARGQQDLTESPPETNQVENTEATDSAPQAERIEDFGEKIAGARKDQVNQVLSGLNSEVTDATTLSEAFPAPNYTKLIEEGVDPRAAAFVAVMRAQIPAKPRKAFRLQQWMKGLTMAQDVARRVLDGSLSIDDMMDRVRSREYKQLEGALRTAELIAPLKPSLYAKASKWNVDARSGYSMFNGEKVSPNTTFYRLKDERGRDTGIWATDFDEMRDKAANVLSRAIEGDNAKPKSKLTPVSVYRDRSTGERFIAFKAGSRVIRLQGGFDSPSAAADYVAENRDAIQQQIDAMRAGPRMRRDTNAPREGVELREGDVTPDDFQEAFGFRGVQFGNYVEGQRRQADLNRAYDALMDLSSMLGVPPKAMSLDGTLGLAFGARGKGGKRSAAAHYEPGQVVINLTKTEGAGSLAHEWFHALDNFIPHGQGTDAMQTELMTDGPARAELAERWREMRQALKDSGFEKRSREFDAPRSKAYFGTPVEMAARAFERYTRDKLEAQGIRNDYLVNISSDPEGPYPNDQEIKSIGPAFDRLMGTLEHRETARGVQLYSLNPGSEALRPAPRAEDIRDALASSPELSGVTVIQSATELPAQSIMMMALQGVNPRDVRGLFVGDQLYVIADNVDDVQEGVRTAVHEAVGHKGMRAVLGEDLDRVMLNLYRNLPNSKEGRDALREVRRDYPFLDPENRKDRITIAEEMVAHLLEKGHRPKAWQRAVAKIRELLRQLFPSVAWTYTDALALGEQSREYLRKQQAENQSDDDQRYALRSKQRANFEDAFSDFTDADRAAAAKIGSRTPPQRAVAWFKEKADRAGLKIRQGMVDRYAALKEMDERLYGETALGENIQRSSWVLARMSNAANGALHAMLHNGRIKLNRQERIIEMQDGDAKGLGEVLGRLGSAAEIERFMGWIAGNRAARLAQDGRENLFDVGDINAMQAWNRGQTEDGRSRQQLYKEVFDEFQQYRDDVLAVAEQSGIITSEQREMWGEEFYVPFYRLAEDDQQVSGMMATSGLSRQQAYKRLKGGTQNLNDLLQNTMMNFHHLLDASLKNQAAAQAIENAKKLGMAERVPESNRDTKRSTFVMENGQKAFYEIDDPLVFTALTALAHPGMNSMAMKVMRGFKRVFTNLTTTTPQFMIANLIRDSLQASATSDVSKNAFKNVIEGGRSYKDERIRAQMLASGASFNFGHLYGNNPDELRAQLTRNMRNAKLVNGPSMVPSVLRAGWTWWNDVNNATENLNRAAIYSQNRDKGALRAAFESRDLIDFSAHGAWPAVRILIDIVPFLNARIQGLDKIYRSGMKPGASVLAEAFGKGKANVTDKQAAARFWTVTGAVTLATIALYLHNQDDEEYQKLEDWQKDTYWFMRFGDQAFFIPKPFEVGAMATLAERMTEQFVDDKATGKLFAQRLGHMMTDTFSFSPVPQMMQPALDIYANYDAFTGRPIEGMGMERLSPELRRRANTSKAAEWISGALNSTVGAIGDPDKNPLALSPVQVDHLIGGYFGQVGTWVASSADVAWRAATGVENPAQRWYEYQPVRRFYRNLGDEDRYTKYGTIFYEGLREANRAYSDAKELREMGRLADAAEVATNKRDMLALRLPLNRAQRRLNTINQQIDIIRRSNLDGEVKRQRIDRLNAVKNQIQRALGEQVQEARAR